MKDLEYKSIIEREKSKVASRLWDLEIPKTTPEGPPEGHQFGQEVVKYLRRIGFYRKGVYK